MENIRKQTGVRLDKELIRKLKLKSAWLEITFEDLCNRILWKDVENFKLGQLEEENLSKKIEEI